VIQNNAFAVTLPYLFPVSKREENYPDGPNQHLKDAGNIFPGVKSDIGIFQAELFSNILYGSLMLTTEDEVVRNISILQLNHHRRHFDQLCLGAEENVNHY